VNPDRVRRYVLAQRAIAEACAGTGFFPVGHARTGKTTAGVARLTTLLTVIVGRRLFLCGSPCDTA
jgi:hypothetical protein